MQAEGAPFRAVLVTGATGFVGSHVVQALIARNVAAEVRCLTRRPTPELQTLAEKSNGRIKICIGDLSGDACRTTVRSHLGDGCDGLINCAAYYRWWSPNPRLYDEINCTAAEELMRLAVKAGVRKVVHVSTILAMGSPPGGWGSTARPLLPDTPPGAAASRYARSKAAGDAAVLRLVTEAGLPACVVMLAAVVGPDRRLVAGPQEDVMRMADLVRGQVPATLGHDTLFTYIGVRDAADAVVAALLRGAPGQRYMVGNQRLTTAQYYDIIAQLCGVPAPTRRVPVWVAAVWAAAASGWGALTGATPQAPPDLIRTVAYGTLLFDSSSSEAELQLEVPYQDITASFREAVQLVQEYDKDQAAGRKKKEPGRREGEQAQSQTSR